MTDSDGAPVEEWRCQECHKLIAMVYLHVVQGEMILEHKCRCKHVNLLTRIAGPSLPTNGQGRLGSPTHTRAVEPTEPKGGPHVAYPPD